MYISIPVKTVLYISYFYKFILSRKEQTCDMFPNGLPDYYLLNCISQDLPQEWIGADVVEETNISQSYFEL